MQSNLVRPVARGLTAARSSRFLVGALLALAACAEPNVAGFEDGGLIPCVTDEACPSGQTCQRGICAPAPGPSDGGLPTVDGGPRADGGVARDGGTDDGGGGDAGLPFDAGVGVLFGGPCANNADCKSGICIASTSLGSVCSKFCTEDCPQDWGCKIIQTGPNRTASVCFPGADLYCQVCTADGCAGPTDRCSQIGAARYCTKDCTATGQCPTGFECVEMRSGADGGLVAPPATATDGGLPADGGGPSNSNDAGVAADAGANGVDGGVADAGAAIDAGAIVDAGAGSGIRQCVPITRLCPGCIDHDGDLYGIGADCRGPDCNDSDPTINPGAPELCNGRDDNCDGRIDEGYDLSSDNQNCGACGLRCDTGAGQVCCNGQCVRPASDPNNCGACGNTLTGANICLAGETCCTGSCVNTDTSLTHCGACSTAPRPRSCLTDGSQLCCAGSCRDIRNDDANCGGCGDSSTNTNICRVVFGERCCSGTCRNILADSANCGGCDGMPRRCAAGTEACCMGQCTTIIDNDTACGACGNNCTVVPGGNCCGVACFNKLTDREHCGDSCISCTGTRPECCGGGCADLVADVRNCGACGHMCNAGESCCGGQCKNLREDNDNCGACGTVCGAGQTCCDGQCKNLDSDPNNCGATCATRRTCTAPYGTCCGGACINTQTDDANCGRCGGKCTTSAGQKCCSGTCKNIQSGDVNNCGGCGSVCSLPNVSSYACSGGACQIVTCTGGWSNVDGTAGNGCECAKNEPTVNDLASQAIDLGTITDNGNSVTVQLRLVPWSGSEGHDVDWYRFTATDTLVGTFSPSVTLSGLPGNNYRLTVYRGPPPGSGSGYSCGFLCLGSCNYPASKQATSNGAGSVSIGMGEGSICSDDGGTFWISIEQLSGAGYCGDITLTVRNG